MNPIPDFNKETTGILPQTSASPLKEEMPSSVEQAAASAVLASPLQSSASSLTDTHIVTPNPSISTTFKLNELFQGTLQGDEKKALRREIPRREDPILQELIKEGKFIKQCRAEGSVEDLNNPITEEYNPMICISGEQKFIIYKMKQEKPRLITDQPATRARLFIQPGLSSQVSDIKASDLLPTIKSSCSIIHSDEDRTFRESQGIIVYCAPTDEDAMIGSPASFDIISPSEVYMKEAPFYDSARQVVLGYIEDQEKLKLASDFVDGLVARLKKVIPSESPVVEQLTALDSSLFEKKYYTEEIVCPRIQRQVDVLLELLREKPEMEKELGVTTLDLTALRETIVKFVQDTNVLNRGLHRQEITGYDLSKTANHPLHPAERSRNQQIRALHRELVSAGLLKEMIPDEGETMTKEEMENWLNGSKDKLFNTIYLRTMSNSTVTEAVSSFKTIQANEKYMKILEQLEGKETFHPALKEQIETLRVKLEEEMLAMKEFYNEVQMYTNQLDVVGIGVKPPALEWIQSPLFKEIQNNWLLLLALKDNQKEQEELILKELNEKLQSSSNLTKKDVENAVVTFDIMVEAQKNNIPLFLHKGPNRPMP